MANPMTKWMRHAFHQVVQAHLPDWLGSTPEPQVMIDRQPVPISAVCAFVSNPNLIAEPMPDLLVDLIVMQADASYPLLLDQTYQGGARYVGKIIERRRKDFQAGSPDSGDGPPMHWGD
jgi:hypothetical protein